MKIDIVGSFLPPESLTNARRTADNGHIDMTVLKQAENEAIKDLVERQINAGLNETTSGELRLNYWDKDFYFGLKGITKVNFDSGHVYQNVESSTDLLRITDRIGFNPEHPFFEDFRFLSETTGKRAGQRQVLPSPANLYLEILSMSNGNTCKIYTDEATLIQDIVSAYNSTIMHFYSLGCRHLQFDDIACGLMCEDNYTKRLLQGGVNLIGLHETIVHLINSSLAGLPADMEISIYLSGGDTIIPEWEFITYPDNIMPKILSRANVNKFFMPFDIKNPYQIEVLRHVGDDKKVVLGLADAHSPFPDDIDAIRATISAAERIVPAANLSVSHKTGFKLSTFETRGLTYEDQWRKLSLLKTELE